MYHSQHTTQKSTVNFNKSTLCTGTKFKYKLQFPTKPSFKNKKIFIRHRNQDFMHNHAHYRPTNNLRIPQLQDCATTVIHHQIIEIVFQYYKRTVTEEVHLNVSIFFTQNYSSKFHTINYKTMLVIQRLSATNNQTINKATTEETS